MGKIVNWFSMKKVLVLIFIMILIIGGVFMMKKILKGNNNVSFETVAEENIPEKIKEILPRYKNLERALACKVDDVVYVIATRGEKPTGGYTIKIDKIVKEKIDEKNKVVVYTTFKDPKAGDVVTQVVTYPYSIVKTDLDELPDTIELKVKYED
ncbi:MAG: protease complex subunit PrcB family protein [Anaeromicrobium sp.]|jgi:hypothetical protein|uniref:protease complex subunit PrcB family protein n=1 Tax=Anaeromicrobium sp. TaxID=1929132 RepID=UPI0025E51C78|nr:protease complex subunit PrcB family protein [Anaeromicrobium sp.]MCT4594549.1 protease complex subunit PrcB family protein [Anaeromicrobium sp.]